jgi:glyoxylase-like metal-dependent hydrolase (beta-lactamase superfamily II)
LFVCDFPHVKYKYTAENILCVTALTQITGSVWDYYVEETIGHISIIKLKEGLLFIDSSVNPKISAKVRAEVEKVVGLPAKYHAITHHHFDHVFGSQVFSDCEIISSKATSKLLKNRDFTIWGKNTLERLEKELKDFKLISPTILFENEYRIQDDNLTICIKQLDGHTLGSSIIHVPEEKIVVTGDLMCSVPLVLPFYGDSSGDIYQWIKALEKIALLSPEIIIPGHGEITNIKRIEEQKKHMMKCINWMEEFIENKGTPDELKSRDDYPQVEEIPDMELFIKISKERLYYEIKRKKEA